ncbi:hypothetical protein E3J84_00095 [Candidatus Aerophobetes bacterium]|uniref:Uncharacterized protein n=1 Tax=Aerophobetes bacterium TaxID=2030807 RepID=A0A523S5U2_UNCAE|nr:MAG: hypothetical protein E3J84_00095 [Candidatus Aerophobetes bacterium]
MADKKLNNPTPGSGKEQPEKGTGLDEKSKGGEELLAGKFKSEEAKVKSYEELEKRHTEDRQEVSGLKERLAKLEGMQEMQQRQAQRAPQITAEEYQKMNANFKDDFTEDSLRALANFNRPLSGEVERQREELQALKDEMRSERERRGELVGLADKARKEDPELFDKLKPEIEKELREDANLARYENPYTAAFCKVRGQSYRSLAKGTDAERESFVEGSSLVPPEKKGLDALKDKYKKEVIEAKDTSRL